MTKEEQKQFEKEQRAAVNEAIKQQAALDASIENLEKPGDLQQPLESAEEREAAATASIEPAVVTAEAPVKPAAPAAPAATPTPAPVVTPAQPAATPAAPAETPAQPIATPAAPVIEDTGVDVVAAAEERQRRNNEVYDSLIERNRVAAEKQAAELRSLEQGDRRAARWASIGEAVAAFGNSLAVAGGASHQQYKPISQDWMRQADASRKERMSRIASLEDNLRQQEARIAEMKNNGEYALIEAQENVVKQKLQQAYTRAQIEHQRAMAGLYDARTQAELKKAQQKADEAEKALELIQSKIKANEALASQRYASASATAKQAETRANESEAKLKESEARVKELESRTGKNNAVADWYNNNKGRGTLPYGTGPVKPQNDKGNSAESKKKEETPSLDKIFG